MLCKLVDQWRHAGRPQERLQAAKQRASVRRKAELAAFDEALCTGGRLLFVQGPVDIGKSALLGPFGARQSLQRVRPGHPRT
ncbi:hypothetical protein GCM10009863_00720 [Streptomyces axinellae]|uniref:Orc1-like AAA ATPase domain-containing protein n=1 Tax=Streptomyces axinellae TaxID=552788 RepID=A0ABN3PMF1_9ACTN